MRRAYVHGPSFVIGVTACCLETGLFYFFQVCNLIKYVGNIIFTRCNAKLLKLIPNCALWERIEFASWTRPLKNSVLNSSKILHPNTSSTLFLNLNKGLVLTQKFTDTEKIYLNQWKFLDLRVKSTIALTWYENWRSWLQTTHKPRSLSQTLRRCQKEPRFIRQEFYQ